MLSCKETKFEDVKVLTHNWTKFIFPKPTFVMFLTTIQTVHVRPINSQTRQGRRQYNARQDNSCKDQSSQLDQANFNKTN